MHFGGSVVARDAPDVLALQTSEQGAIRSWKSEKTRWFRPVKNLNDYCTLGRTGLKISPLGLGVMTYGWRSAGSPRGFVNSIVLCTTTTGSLK